MKSNETDAGANSSPIVYVALRDLVLDHSLQIRRRTDPGTVTRYCDAMLAGAEFPPIIVARVNGAPLLIDGWHRTAAAADAGKESLSAVIVEAREDELRWLAADFNLRHGRPLSRAEAREVFRAYVTAGRHRKSRRRTKSSREIVRDLNGLRTHHTILQWMRQDFPSVWRQMIRSEDEPRHDGGTPKNESATMQERLATDVLDYLNGARATMAAIEDPEARGRMIAEAEQVVEEMRKQRPWTPMPCDTGMPF